MNKHAAIRGRRAGRTQQGATLLVALIFLLIFAVMAASALSGSMTSARSIGNSQWRNEAVNAANDAIDRLLSSVEFAERATIVTSRINAAPLETDVNGDGNPDVRVTFPPVTIAGATTQGPSCLRARPVPETSLDPKNPQDTVCFGGSDPNATGVGMADAAGGGSSASVPPGTCSNTEWTITVRAEDEVTNTRVDVTQGVGVRVMRPTAESYCH